MLLFEVAFDTLQNSPVVACSLGTAHECSITSSVADRRQGELKAGARAGSRSPTTATVRFDKTGRSSPSPKRPVSWCRKTSNTRQEQPARSLTEYSTSTDTPYVFVRL